MLQVNLSGRRVEKILASHHLGNLLVGVVHHDRQLICEQTVATFENEVTTIFTEMHCEYAHFLVRKFDAVPGNPQSVRCVAVWPQRPAPAKARINRRGPSSVSRVVLPNLPSRAGAGIGQALAFQVPKCAGVMVCTLALVDHLRIPVQTIGLKSAEYVVGGARNFPRRVYIFDPDVPFAAG
jgi:hypothetical protein